MEGAARHGAAYDLEALDLEPGCHALRLSLLYIVTWWGSSNTEIEGSPHSTGGPEASRCSLDGQAGSWSEGERI